MGNFSVPRDVGMRILLDHGCNTCTLHVLLMLQFGSGQDRPE